MKWFREISFLCWPDFTRFRFLLTRFHEKWFLRWPDFTMLTRFHEISFLCWPDFTRFPFCIDPISGDFVFVLTRFHEIYSRHHRNFDFCYNLAPQYSASLWVLYVCAAEYSGRSHPGTRLSLLICCSKWLVMTQHPSTSFNHIESPWWCKHVN